MNNSSIDLGPAELAARCINQTNKPVFLTGKAGTGKTTTITGTATVVNSVTNAELEVVFDNFFTRLFKVKGDYTIIKLDADYEYVMIGSKDRKSLWIMSRETTMPSAVLKQYVNFAAANGFDVSKLVNSKF